MKHWQRWKFMVLRKGVPPKITDKLSDGLHSFVSKYIEPYEAERPVSLTDYPGPKSQKVNDFMQGSIGTSHSGNNIREAIVLEKSFGNYFEDVDGNIVLDMFMDNGRNAMGYNSRKWIKHTKLQKYDRFLNSRPAMGVMPPVDYPKLAQNVLNSIAPRNIQELYFSCGCGTSANENAIKLSFLKKFFEMKGNNKLTPEEEESVGMNHVPGAPNFSVLGFEGGYHGKFLNMMSLRNEHKNFARHDWPIAPFPNIKYPYEEHLDANRKEENRCVEETAKIIKTNDSIAAMIIEPLQIQGGMRYASSSFYRDLVDLCYEHNIAFICDETNTSGWASGRAFMHQNWNLEKAVHMVTFGGRMQVCGLFYQQQFRPKFGNMVNGTWNGDPLKLLQLFDTMQQINKDWIDGHSAQFWQGAKAELLDLQQKSKIPISNIRGIGKIFAFDTSHELLRDEIVHKSRVNGYKVNPIGKHTIGFTPSLLFTEIHLARYKDFLLDFVPATLHMNSFNSLI